MKSFNIEEIDLQEISVTEREEVKNFLIDKLLDFKLSDTECEMLMELLEKKDFRKLILRIFDIDRNTILSEPESERNLLWYMNKIGKYIKNSNVLRKLDNPYFRDNKKVIIAEGDSWFEFPLFVTDILDWIKKLTPNPLFSLAYAGDWVANIVYEEEYIDRISIYQPEVFLISGGGNDIAGRGRLSLLVNKPSIAKITPPVVSPDINSIISQNFNNGEISAEQRAEMIVTGSGYLNKDFFALMKTFELMYKIVFSKMRGSRKFDDMKIIMQGYDFPVPSNNKNIFINPLRLIVNNGQWLFYPLVRKGISDPLLQKCIASAFIYHFNETLISVARYCNRKANLDYVFHIDSRGALKQKDWADELHPFSRPFRKISEVYIRCINGDTSPDKENPFVYPVRFF